MLLSSKIQSNPAFLTRVVCISACLWVVAGVSANAASSDSWTPRLSEKIIMLPPHQIERAVENDYKSSPLAAALTGLDGQIAQAVNTTETLMGMKSSISPEDSLELRHQIISSKRDYIKLTGDKLNKNRERLESKRDVYENLLRQAQRQNRKNDGQVSVVALQEEARERAQKAQARISQSFELMDYQKPTKTSEAYDRNLNAIEAIRQAIQQHPMQSQMPLTDISDQPRALQAMIAQVEVEISLVMLEEELLGHMAQLLALDAMALADDVSNGSALSNETMASNNLSVSTQAYNLFADQ